MIPGKKISLRPLDRSHLDSTRAWANDPELMRLLGRALPVSEAEHEKWFASLSERTDCKYFAIETTREGKHIGNVWLWEIDSRHRRAEVRIMIGDRNYHGSGAGTEAISLISEFAFKTLHLHKVRAYVLAINPRARAAFTKAGFLVEGVLREDRMIDDAFTDVYLLGNISN